MLDLYLSESYSDCKCKQDNGFLLGKKWMNVTVKMWKDDMCRGNLYPFELYEDPNLPDWWLDKVLK